MACLLGPRGRFALQICFVNVLVATVLIFTAGDARANPPTTQPLTTAQIQAGVFGFPQAQAQVLCDNPQLRFSAWNNTDFLYLQAIVWADSDDAGTVRLPDGREFGDFSNVSLDLDADAKITVGLDRTYYLNPMVIMPGMRYCVAAGVHGETTALQSDSAGRGAIRYLLRSDGPRIRVDSYLIPLSEIHRAAGDPIRLAFFAMSVQPKLSLNSLGIAGARQVFYLPLEKYHAIKLSDRTDKLDPLMVPTDR